MVAGREQTDFLYAVDDDTVAAGYAAHVPAPLRERGLNVAHTRPLVGIEYPGHAIRTFRVEPERAWSFPRLQINPAHSWAVMTFDCDRGDVDRDVPIPHWEVVNARNGHLHAAYILRTPVHRYRGARSRPQDYATAVESGLIGLLEADAGYTGVLTRNPVKPGPECHTIWYARTEPYDLWELADWLELRQPQQQGEGPAGLLDSLRVGCIGRNVYLHRWGISRAFRLAHSHPLDRIEALMLGVLAEENERRVDIRDFAAPLPDSEIRHIARSNGRYVAKRYDRRRLSEIQSERGRRGRQALTDRLQEEQEFRNRNIYEAYHVAKMKQAEIARAYGMSQPRVSQIIRNYKPGHSS